MNRLVIAGLLFCGVVFAHGAGVPTTMANITTSTTPIWDTYALQGGSSLSQLKGVSNFAAYNGTSTAVAISVRSHTCTVATNDHYYLPASTGLVVENVAIAKSICLKALGAASINSGTVALSAW